MHSDDPLSMPGGGSLQDPTIVGESDALVGTTIGRYAILEKVAKGGTATVYRALDNVLNREVAVKILHEHLGGKREVVIRFKNEAQVIAQLRHPNILTVFDFLEHNGRAVLVVEFMPGVTLSTLVKSTNKIPEDFVMMIGLEILQGLRLAHQKGITHRDIKPANILLHSDLGVKISDFGLAKLVNADDGLTKEGIFVGTPSFSSPEQIEGKPLDQRSDIFSLGLTLYILATRSHAFKRQGDSTTTVWFKIVKGKFESIREKNPDLSPEFEKIINRSLEVDLTKRYQTAGEMIADLEHLMRARKLVPYESALREFLRSPNAAVNISRAHGPTKKAQRLIWGLGIGFFVIALWIGGFLFQQRVAEERNPKSEIGLNTGPDSRVPQAPEARKPEPSVAVPEEPAPTPNVETKKVEKTPIVPPKPKASAAEPLNLVDLSAGIYIGQAGRDLKTFTRENFNSYRERVRPKKSPLLVSSRFGDVDLELNPFTQNLKLEWQAGPEASAYRLEIANDHGFRAPIFTGSVPSKNMMLERFFDKSQTIFWRVSYLDEAQNVFLIDPVRKINLKLKGASDYFDIIVPQSSDSFKGKSLEVKAYGPEGGSLRCETITNAKGQSEWVSAVRDQSFLKATLSLAPQVTAVLCEAKDTSKKITYFMIPISVVK